MTAHSDTKKAADDPTVNTKQSSSIATIRVATDGDGPAVAKIWEHGLQQTIDSSWWIVRPLMRYSFDQLVFKTLGVNGDVGPKGSNLIENWVLPTDRNFFVAVEASSQTVIGCVGVRTHNCDVKSNNSDSVRMMAEVERLSVDSSFRRMGVARNLMEKVHEWGRQQNCDIVLLNSANPKAIEFYKSIGYVPIHWSGFRFMKSLD
jgi:GNAT superfamily N-acetyltransferase